jgi:hypothetical protein
MQPRSKFSASLTSCLLPVRQAKYDDFSAFIDRQVKLEAEDAAGGGIGPFGKFGKKVAIAMYRDFMVSLRNAILYN